MGGLGIRADLRPGAGAGGPAGYRYGYKRLFLAGLSLFTLASVACGVSMQELLLFLFIVLQNGNFFFKFSLLFHCLYLFVFLQLLFRVRK